LKKIGYIILTYVPPVIIGKKMHYQEGIPDIYPIFRKISLLAISLISIRYLHRASRPVCHISFTFVTKSEIGDLRNPHENGRKVRIDTDPDPRTSRLGHYSEELS